MTVIQDETICIISHPSLKRTVSRRTFFEAYHEVIRRLREG